MKKERTLEELKVVYESVSMNDLQYGQFKQAISRGKKDRTDGKWQKVMAAAAVFVLILIALPNFSGKMASAMAKIPIFGDLIEAVTFREYRYADKEKEADIEIPEVKVKSRDDTKEKKKNPADTAVKSVEEINSEVQKLTKKIVRHFQKSLKKEGYESVTVNSSVLNQNEKYFTLKLTCDEAEADGYEETSYYTIDLNTGKRLQLRDLFKKNSDYITPISENIKQQMRDQMKADENITYWLDDKDFPDDNFKSIRPDTGFYMNEKNEIIIAFNEGDVAPMYMGAVEFAISDDVIGSIRVE